MMAAMMFPSVAPTVALYARMTRRRSPAAPLVFTAGYLLTWTAAGLLAYGLVALGRELLGDAARVGRRRRWVAGGTLLVAAAYEVTPSRTSACRSAAARSASCSAPGATGCPAR